MPEFQYTVEGPDATAKRRIISAKDEADARDRLAKSGLAPSSLVPLQGNQFKISAWEKFGGVPVVEKLFFTQNLRVMMHAGLSLSRALNTVASQIKHRYFRKVIQDIRQNIESGVALSAALSKHPKVFPELFVSMIAAGETSGQLDEALSRLSAQMKKSYGLRSKVRNALIYPIVVVIGMVGVSVLMLVMVIPKIAEIFAASNAPLPLPTRILIGLSSIFTKYGLFTSGVVLVIIGFFITLNRTSSGRRAFHAAYLRLPILGSIIRKVNLASFARSFSSLLATDIPIVETFKIIARTMGNSLYREALVTCANQLKTGSTVVKTLERYPRLFPPMVTQMIAVGEESGSLEGVSAEVASFLEDDVDQTMANLSTILEPLIILVLGAGVAAIAVAVILPIYSLTSQIT